MPVRVGDTGLALSPMSPSGSVEIDGVRHDARSDGRFIETGSRVIVLRGDTTGYVVSKLEPGKPVPRLPNHGDLIRKAEFQRSSAEVAAADREERERKWRDVVRGMKYGSLAAAALGGLVGLASGGLGWYFGWSGVAEPIPVATLLGGSLAAGAAFGVVLFFLTGWASSLFGAMEGETAFTPDFLVVFAALVGAAVGFWWHFDSGDALTIATWTTSCAFISAAVAWVLSSLLSKTAGAAAGVE